MSLKARCLALVYTIIFRAMFDSLDTKISFRNPLGYRTYSHHVFHISDVLFMTQSYLPQGCISCESSHGRKISGFFCLFDFFFIFSDQGKFFKVAYSVTYVCIHNNCYSWFLFSFLGLFHTLFCVLMSSLCALCFAVEVTLQLQHVFMNKKLFRCLHYFAEESVISFYSQLHEEHGQHTFLLFHFTTLRVSTKNCQR